MIDGAIPREVARRFLVIRQGLAPPRRLPGEPESVMRVFDRLGSIQFDPLEVAGRNHDLVLLARIRDYRREWTEALLYEERRLFEAYNKSLNLLPAAELPWYRITWDRNRERHERETFMEHGALVDELLTRIREHGPTSTIDIEPRAAIDWWWRPTNQVRAVLEALAQSGVLGLRRRDGNRRVYDLLERLFPPELLAQRPPERDQRRHRLLSRYRAHGLLGRSGSQELWIGTDRSAAERTALRGELVERGEIVPVAVDGIRGERFVVRGDLPLLEQAEREVRTDAASGTSRPGGEAPGVAFIAPLDPLLWDRQLLVPLFAFDYLWEVYVPAARRRWGYYVLPVLWGDRLVGRIEPRIDRAASTLRIEGLWWEDGFDPVAEPGFASAFADALDVHRRFAGVARIGLPRAHRHRPLVSTLREQLTVARGRDRIRV